MKHIIYFFFLGPILGNFSLYGQTSFHTNGSQAMNFYCDYKNTSGTSSARDLLSILSGAGKHEAAGFHINYTRNHEIIRTTGKEQVKFNTWLDNIHVSSTVLYKDFNVAAFVIPTDVELNVKAYRGRSRLFSACWRSRIQRGMSSNMDKTHRDTLNGYNLQVEEIKFKFNSSTRSALRDYIGNIDAYEKAALLVNNHQRLLNEFNWQHPDPETLEAVHLDIEQIRIDIVEIKHHSFWNKLPLQNNDPLALRLNFDAFEQNYVRNRQKIELLLAKIHELYLDKARMHYQEGHLDAAKRLANKALNKQPDYLPANVLLVELDAQDEDWDTAVKEAAYLLNHKSSQMGLEDKQRLLAIVEQVVNRHVNTGQEQTISGDYDNAIDAYDAALYLVEHTKGYKGSKIAILNYKKEAAKDWMEECINLAKKGENKAVVALQKKEIEASISALEGVLSRIVRAQKLDTKHHLNVSIDLDIWETQIEQKLFDQATLVAKKHIQTKDWDTARDYAYLAYRVAISRQEEGAYALYKKVDYQRYLIFIEQAKQEKDHNLSIQVYQVAQKIELRHQFTKDKQPENINLAIKSRAKQALLEEVAIYLKSKNNNEIEQAKKEITAYALEYQIEQEPVVLSAIEKLSDWKCANAQGEFDEQEAYIIQLLEERKFRDAQKEFKQLNVILETYPDCSIDASRMASLEQKVILCYDYEALLATFNFLPQSISFDWCRTHIATAEQLNEMYLDPTIQLYFKEPACFDLYPYLYAKKMPRLLRLSAEHYRKKGVFDYSFALFKEAVRMDKSLRNYDHNLQGQLGTTFANQGYDENKHWKTALFELTGDLHKGLPKFDKAFKKQWLKIKRLRRL